MSGKRQLLNAALVSLLLTTGVTAATHLHNTPAVDVVTVSGQESVAHPYAAPLFLAAPTTTTTTTTTPPQVRHVAPPTTSGYVAAGTVSEPVTTPPKTTTISPNSGGRDWDYVADCESGKHQKDGTPIRGTANWSLSDGNGYYGGLQFSSATWRQAGGHQYAPEAHMASREQQIAIANSWLDKTSWHQWPICGKYL